jgi:DNA-binding CsgD family transcriptional regulator
LLLAARRDADAAAEVAARAVALGETVELRLEVARTLLVAGQIERRRRRKGGRPSPGTELTASERRVASMAAAGLTNREVAAKLFMSAKTVEAHLARVLPSSSSPSTSGRARGRGVRPGPRDFCSR